MSQNLDVATRYVDEVWNSGRMDVCDELFTADHSYHDALLPDLPAGPDGVRQRVQTYLAGVPDAKVQVEDVIEMDDKLAARWTWGGTNSADLMGLPASGKSASTTGVHIFRFENGRIAESWVSFNALGFLLQLDLAKLGPA